MQKSLIIFSLDEQRYALRLFVVERIVRVVEFTPLPQAPEIVLGVINVRGAVMPVVNLRKRFRLPERDLNLSDHLIIAHTAKRAVALVVDAVRGVMERWEEDTTVADRILPDLAYVEGVVKLEDGLMLIHNLDTLLSLEEEKTLEQAMAPT